MSCFRCFMLYRSMTTRSKREHASPPSDEHHPCGSPAKSPILVVCAEIKKQKAASETKNKEQINQVQNGNIAAQTFNFRELATATNNFRQECLLGEGGFGRVFKGKLQASGQVVAVKQLDRNGLKGNKEFLVEVLTLSVLRHENLVNLVGYCADGDQRLLVYEYMSGGSLEDRLLDVGEDQKPLTWFARIKIAFGAAKGLEYLHDKANPPVIYRDLKSSNILLDEDFNPKLSDFGLAKLGPLGDKMHISSRVMCTYGYCAPEYTRTGHLTLRSDVYSFGVVLLELISGRRAIDNTRPVEEQNLVAWAQSLFRDPKRFPEMADPLLKKQFPEKDLHQAVAIAAMCLQEEEAVRPLMSDVVTTLSFLSATSLENIPAPLPPPTTPSQRENYKDHHDQDISDDGSPDVEDRGGGIGSDSEDEHRGSVIIEAKDWLSSSSNESGERSSRNGRASSRHKGSFRSHEGISVSSSHGSSEITGGKGSASSRKSSKRRSRKSSDGSVFSGDNGSRESQDRSDPSRCNSSRGSKNGNICVYLDHNSISGSQNGR